MFQRFNDIFSFQKTSVFLVTTTTKMNMQRIVVRVFQRIVEKAGLILNTFNLFQNLVFKHGKGVRRKNIAPQKSIKLLCLHIVS